MLSISLFIWVAISIYLFFLTDSDGIAAAWTYLGGLICAIMAIYTGVIPVWTIIAIQIILLFPGVFYSYLKADYNDNSGIGIAIMYLYLVLFVLSFIITIPVCFIFQ